MSKILICGHFNNGQKAYDGQTIKTINIYNELKKKYGNKNIIKIDTYYIKRRPIYFIKEIMNC